MPLLGDDPRLDYPGNIVKAALTLTWITLGVLLAFALLAVLACLR
jgi:hypothetical protein